MPLIFISTSNIRPNTPVPTELSEFILPSQWNLLCLALSSAREDGLFWACCLETACCVLFLFPCIYLCHPCVSKGIENKRIEDNIKDLNIRVFNGQPVLSVNGDTVAVNTDLVSLGNSQNIYICRTNTADISPIHTTVASQATSTEPYNAQPAIPVAAATTGLASTADHNGYVEVVASPVSAQTVQNLRVRIPPGAGPGSVLTVAAPNGTTLSVVAPPGAYPGQEIIVKYWS